MSLRTHTRRIGTTLTMGAAAVTALALTTTSASAATLWCGGGRGLTAERAIQNAIDDATTSASGAGQFSCELVGDPQVFETFTDPIFGHLFRAQVNMSCS